MMKKKLREKDIPRIKAIVVSAFVEIDYHKDFDVYFTVLCNRLLERIKNGEEDLVKKFLICCKYNSAKNLKSLNKKQFIVNWSLDLRGISNEWTRL